MTVMFYSFQGRLVCNHGPSCCRTHMLSPAAYKLAEADHAKGCNGLNCQEWTPPLPTLDTIPLPGAHAFDRTVIASAYYRELVPVEGDNLLRDEYVLLCMNRTAPFYSVIIGVQGHPNIPHNVMDAENIREAAELFEAWGGE